MPVINIPQTEFAHNAFFSLHRPLLGLSSEDEKPFFSNQHIEEEGDEQLANYMANVKPFEAPQPPGMTDEVEDKKNDSSYSISFSTGDAMLPEEEIYLEQTLPMYYMPESDEIVDYLSTIQEKLVRQNALYNNNNNNGVGSVGRTKRYTSTINNTTRNKDGIITRYHKRQQQGIYRHRWNK
ncbi:unnamed protein product [Cunninghamella echinulata]